MYPFSFTKVSDTGAALAAGRRGGRYIAGGTTLVDDRRTPAAHRRRNRVSSQPQAAVGAPLSRVDGRAKVTGKADYAADHDVPGVVHAVVVDSSIARGHITGIDTHKAGALNGVLRIISHLDKPALARQPGWCRSMSALHCGCAAPATVPPPSPSSP